MVSCEARVETYNALPCAAEIMWTGTFTDVINISACATSAWLHKRSVVRENIHEGGKGASLKSNVVHNSPQRSWSSLHDVEQKGSYHSRSRSVIQGGLYESAALEPGHSQHWIQ